MTPFQSLLTQSAAAVTLSLRAVVIKLQVKTISQDPGLWITIFKE